MSRKKRILGLGLLILAALGGIRILGPWAGKNDPFLRRIALDQMSRLSTAIESFRHDNGFYPTTEQGLDALISPSKVPPYPKHFFLHGYIDRMNIPKDPWGRIYEYRSPDGDRPYSIVSKGRVGWYSGDDVSYPEKGKP